MTIDTSTPISRRGLFAAVLGGTAAAIAGTVSRAERVLAAGSDGETVAVGGTYDDARSTTTLGNNANAETVLRIRGQRGPVVSIGSQRSLKSVRRPVGINVFEELLKGSHNVWIGGGRVGLISVDSRSFGPTVTAIHAVSTGGTGVEAFGDGIGVKGNGDVGVKGIGGSGPAGKGVKGVGARGGHFTGARAQVRMAPSTKATHPARGRRGDFFVDKTGRLWFCKGNTRWTQLA